MSAKKPKPFEHTKIIDTCIRHPVLDIEGITARDIHHHISVGAFQNKSFYSPSNLHAQILKNLLYGSIYSTKQLHSHYHPSDIKRQLSTRKFIRALQERTDELTKKGNDLILEIAGRDSAHWQDIRHSIPDIIGKCPILLEFDETTNAIRQIAYYPAAQSQSAFIALRDLAMRFPHKIAEDELLRKKILKIANSSNMAKEYNALETELDNSKRTGKK